MNFSEPLRVTSSQLHWAPNGDLCAVAATARLEIRDGFTLQLLNTFSCAEVIQSVEWAPDSSLVYTANYKRGIVEVWQPSDPSWKCKIDEAVVGLIKVHWTPDSRHLLTTAEFHLRITIWSLISKSVFYIKQPKEASPGLHFSFDGDYLAVAERRDGKDSISIFETKSWTQVKNFDVSTRDLSGLCWAPDDSVLAVWDSPAEYRLQIYTITGQCLSSFSAYQWALGIKCVSWSPSSQFLAIGSYDQNVRIMNNVTWKTLLEFNHAAAVESEDCAVFAEKELPLTGYPATLASIQGLPLCLETNYEEEKSRPVVLAQVPHEIGKHANPKVGVSEASFSCDGRFLATRADNMPATVWIWGLAKLALAAVLVHCSPVKDLKWCPNRACLAMCTGGNHVYMWTPFGAVTVMVPNASTMQVTSLRWHPSGSKVALISKEEFSVCFLSPDAKRVEEEDSEPI